MSSKPTGGGLRLRAERMGGMVGGLRGTVAEAGIEGGTG